MATISVPPQIKRVVRETRAKILAELQSGSLTEFKRSRLTDTLAALDEILADHQMRLGVAMHNVVVDTFQESVRRTVKTIQRQLAAEIVSEAVSLESVFKARVTDAQILGITQVRPDLIRHASESFRHRVRTTVERGVLSGDSVADMAKALVGRGEGGVRSVLEKTYSEAVTIARTEAHRSATSGRFYTLHETERAVGHKFSIWKTWHPVVDSRSRQGHMMAGRHPAIRLDEYFRIYAEDAGRECEMRFPGDANGRPAAYLAENIINCFHPETVIRGTINAAMKSFYEGKMLEIITRSGCRLRVTPNHPIATAGGMKPASLIDKSDHLIRCETNIQSNAQTGDDDQKPTIIDQIFDLLSHSGTIFTHDRIGVDLHGDAKNVIGEINVVTTDRKLAFELEASGCKRIDHFQLVSSDMATGAIARSRSFKKVVVSPFQSSNGFVRFGSLPDNFFPVAADYSPLEKFGLASPSDMNTSFEKSSPDSPTIDSNFVRNLFQRSPGFVSVDQVVDVFENSFRGYVYDLQSDSGLIVADNLVVSNCRCVTVEKIFPADASPDQVRDRMKNKMLAGLLG